MAAPAVSSCTMLHLHSLVLQQHSDTWHSTEIIFYTHIHTLSCTDIYYIYTVTPVEELTNRTTCILPAQSPSGHGTIAVRSRYSLGTLPVHLWYGIVYTQGSVPSDILDASNSVHVLFVLLFESRNRGLAGFGSAIDTIPYKKTIIASSTALYSDAACSI